MPRGPEGPLRRPAAAVLRPVVSSPRTSRRARTCCCIISEKEQSRQLVEASVGYDLPSFKSMYDFDTWKKVEPPVGTVYSYPPRGDEQTRISAHPARSEVGAQMYNQAINTVMVAKFYAGQREDRRGDQVGRRESSKARCAPEAFQARRQDACRPDRPACGSISRSVSAADTHPSPAAPRRCAARAGARSGLQRFMRRRSTIAFLMCLPLIVIVAGLIIYPALLLDLSFDAEQGADALHRPRQFQLPAVARHVLDGGASSPRSSRSPPCSSRR